MDMIQMKEKKMLHLGETHSRGNYRYVGWNGMGYLENSKHHHDQT